MESEAPVPTTVSDPVKEEEYKLQLISDKSKAKVGFLHYLAIFLWIGWFSFYFYFPVFFVLGMYLFPKVVGVVVLIIITSAVYPIHDKYQPKWGFKLGGWLMCQAEEYFRIRIFCEDFEEMNKCAPAILTIEPHDVLPVGLCAYSNAINHLSGHIVRGGLASACFQIPGMRHIYSWARATNIEKKTLNKLLSSGQTVCICPGGAHEVTYMATGAKDNIELHLKNRYGFIKIAMQHGASVVPTFAFGQRAAWDFWVPPFQWLHKMGRKAGFIPLVFFGLGGLPLTQAKSVPITLVMGKPIHIPKAAEGEELTTEKLQPFLDQFIAATERIFEKNKDKFDMGHCKLVIH